MLANATPTVVLVHGAWAEASSWSRVIPSLQAAGLAVHVVHNPLTSLADDVAATRRVLAAIEGQVVLVGHSWGGMVISECGEDAKVSALVYISAISGDAGESVSDLVGRHAPPPALSGIIDRGDGFLLLSEAAFVDAVAHDLPAEESRTLAVVQLPLAATTFSEPTRRAAWRTKPSWSLVSTEDRAVATGLQREAAARMGATTVEVACGHMSPLSNPTDVVALVRRAAGV